MKLQATTEEKHHFFASSAARWRVNYDLEKLIKDMKREKYPFAIWMVPGPDDTPYQINTYAPQVEGAQFLILYRNV